MTRFKYLRKQTIDCAIDTYAYWKYTNLELSNVYDRWFILRKLMDFSEQCRIDVHFKQNTQRDNQEWTFQRHWQHWAHKIQDELE
jgi:hypothetical protein